MKITYCPTEPINNFHHSRPLDLIITGETTEGICCSGDVYRISTSQAAKIRKHFCGITDCRCAAGATDQLNEDGTEWGIPVRYCTTKTPSPSVDDLTIKFDNTRWNSETCEHDLPVVSVGEFVALVCMSSYGHDTYDFSVSQMVQDDGVCINGITHYYLGMHEVVKCSTTSITLRPAGADDLFRVDASGQRVRKNPAAAALGSIGGAAKTPAKSAASRANGAKGGRPRKVPSAE